MRLIHTSAATAAILAVSGTAFAAGTSDEVNATMGGTSRVQAGGPLRMVVQQRTATAKQFRVTIRYDVTIRSKTVLGFVAYPCRSTRCDHQSISRITLSPGLRHVTFTGRVPVTKRADGTACVYAQIRDKGTTGGSVGRIVRRAAGQKGVAFCRKVK